MKIKLLMLALLGAVLPYQPMQDRQGRHKLLAQAHKPVLPKRVERPIPSWAGRRKGRNKRRTQARSTGSQKSSA